MKLPREKKPTSSADEDTIQEPRIKLPRETASVDLRNPETGIKGMNIPKQDIVICADIVKHGAEGQKCVLQNSLCLQQNCQNQKLLLQKLTKKSNLLKKFPTCALTLQEHKVKSLDIEIPKVERSTELGN